jgi:UDP-N-acetylmuramate--alanine ligase
MIKIFPDPPANVYLIGIKGQALTAVAQILQAQGYRVSGSDVAEEFPTDAVLKKLNIDYNENFAAANLTTELAAVIYSTAYDESNPELSAAKKMGLPVWSYPEFVALLFELYSGTISVAGSHGKTTTTAILADILTAANYDPTAIVGSTVTAWGSNARLGSSGWLIFETDEYQNKLQLYKPRYVLLTNVDYDHPDFFKDRASYEQAFLEFVAKIPESGCLVVWRDDPLFAKLQAVCRAPLISYGQSAESDWRITGLKINDRGTSFEAKNKSGQGGEFIIPFPGEHYALNALGAIALAVHLGIEVSIIMDALKIFRGTNRRLEKYGEYKGTLVIDDFAHHPTEIQATLTGLRQRYSSRRLLAVFHPHTFTRTTQFLDEFAQALALADTVILLPIYGSAREAQGQVSSQSLVDLINKTSPGKALYLPSLEAATAWLKANLQPDELVVTMGAGNVWQVAGDLVN